MARYVYQRDSTSFFLGFWEFLPPSLAFLGLLLSLSLANLAWITQQHSSRECSDVCLEKLCNIVKCVKRHPKQCIYFGSGSCKYGDSCKYDHGPDLRELLQKSIEEHKNKDNIIKILHERVSELEKKVEEVFDECIYPEVAARLVEVENDIEDNSCLQ